MSFGRIRPYRLIAWALVLLSLVNGPLLLSLCSSRLASFLHRETVYASIVERIRKATQDEQDQALATFRFVQTHMLVFPGQSIKQFGLSKAPLHYLVLQSGWCDQQAGILLSLAQRLGFTGRLLILNPGDNTLLHVVAEIDIDDHPTIMDPYYGLFFLSKAGRLVDRRTVQSSVESRRGVFSPQYQGALLYGSRAVKHELTRAASVIRKPGETVDQMLSFDGFRRLASKAILIYYRLLGDYFLDAEQAVYFARNNVSGYERARDMQLAGRYDDAINEYKRLLSSPAGSQTELPGMVYSGDQPHNPGTYEAVLLFSLGQAYWSKGSYALARKEFTELARRFPDSGWADASSYFVGDMYFRSGSIARARAQWLKTADSYSLPVLQDLYETREPDGSQ